MIVISDTSPISNLVALGRLTWLNLLFGQVVISEEVYQEFARDQVAISGAQGAIDSGWLQIHAVKDLHAVNRLLRDVHIGEASSIILAQELAADFLLIDERAGAQIAAGTGLKTIGVLGILLAAKNAGLIPDVRPSLDQLRNEIGFWVSEKVYQYVLTLANEQVG